MKSILTLLFCGVASIMIGQSTMVHALNYNSTNRDTLIDFPEGDHNQYKKIIMHYSMRCKDGLVSPPVSGQTNIGCGEWDYSCNTNIVDSTQVDSLKRIGPDYVISGFDGVIYEYTTQPTYTTIRSTRKDVEYTVNNDLEILEVGEGNEEGNYNIGLDGDVKSHMLLIKASDILAQGITAGDIGKMKFDVLSNASLFNNLRISMRSTSPEILSEVEYFSDEWTEVYQNNIEISSETLINFHENYVWDGTSNILVKMSYESSSDNSMLLNGELESNGEILTISGNEDNYLSCGASGNFITNNGIPNISNEITVSFWSFGDHKLPVNTTIFEGLDDANRRQVNVHLPWSNGQVYWDCGNNGSNYDRINIPVDPSDYKNKWTHWAFTKNSSTGIMNIYMNGEVIVSGTDKSHLIDIKKFALGSSAGDNPLFYQGSIDDFQLWDIELSQDQIMSGMRKVVDNSHPNYDNLIMNYDFDDQITSNLIDQSSYGIDLIANGRLLQRKWRSNELVKNIYSSSNVPNFSLFRGEYQQVVTETVDDLLIENLPSRVDRYILDGTDRVLAETVYYYAAGEQPIFDENYVLLDTEIVEEEDFIFIDEMEYYSKSPMIYELMSFVTPYGINLDLGIEGKTWSFDVTEFGPILKGTKRIFLNRGGQWQEDMDIRFEFIEGKPVRDIVKISQIWPVTSTAYQELINDNRFEPREIKLNDATKSAEIKSVITGHGQQGEFIPRTHRMSVNGVSNSYQVWTECSDNPVYPQGGTWVYDRAGWCPGAPSDVDRFDITNLISSTEMNTVDYGVSGATGDSRYIVNLQLVEYGEPNYIHNAELIEIRNPSSEIVHERFNPGCQSPVIKIRNIGSEPLTSLQVDYGFDDNGAVASENKQTYFWQGNLGFLEEEEIELPFFPGITIEELGTQFRVSIVTPDEDELNNTLTSAIRPVDHYDSDLIVQFKTNFVPNETSYSVIDQDGNTVFEKSSIGLSGNTIYIDTLKNLSGCLQLVVNDTDGDGLSWWANNDGDGYISVRPAGGSGKTLPTDFGSIYRYDFTSRTIVSNKNVVADEFVKIYPNPVSDRLFIELDNRISKGAVIITNEIGQQIHVESINGRSEFFIEKLKRFPTGIYDLTITTESNTFTQRFVKI